MSEKNIIETNIQPEVPKLQKHQTLDVFVPLATYGHAGIAKFDSVSFIVDDGNVKIRNLSIRNVEDFSVSSDGTYTIYYSDGSNKTFKVPYMDVGNNVHGSFFKIFAFNEDSWIYDGERYHIIVPSSSVGVTNDEYLAFVDVNNENKLVQINDNVIKNSDGSLLLWAEDTYSGRFIIIDGVVPKGEKGPQGLPGRNGFDGTKWHTDTSIDFVHYANDGDLFLLLNPNSNNNGQILQYNKAGNVWRVKGNIQGPQGLRGPIGPQGAHGITPHIGENGNWWIGNTDTGVNGKSAIQLKYDDESLSFMSVISLYSSTAQSLELNSHLKYNDATEKLTIY